MAAILVVEDDKLLGKLVVETLEEAGFQVEWVTNGEAALLKLNEKPFNMVFLDIMLPGNMDGYQILQRIKAPGSSLEKTPVVMLTNSGDMDHIDKAMEMGASDYVVKANIDLSKLADIAKSHAYTT